MHNNCIFLAPITSTCHLLTQYWVNVRSKICNTSKNCACCWMAEETERLAAPGHWVLMHGLIASRWGKRNEAAVTKVHQKACFTSAWHCHYPASKYLVTSFELLTRAGLGTVWLRNMYWKHHISSKEVVNRNPAFGLLCLTICTRRNEIPHNFTWFSVVLLTACSQFMLKHWKCYAHMWLKRSQYELDISTFEQSNYIQEPNHSLEE